MRVLVFIRCKMGPWVIVIQCFGHKRESRSLTERKGDAIMFVYLFRKQHGLVAVYECLFGGRTCRRRTLRAQARGKDRCRFAEPPAPGAAAASLGVRLPVGLPRCRPVSDHGFHLRVLLLPHRMQSQEPREGHGHKFWRSGTAPATASEVPVVGRRTALTFPRCKVTGAAGWVCKGSSSSRRLPPRRLWEVLRRREVAATARTRLGCERRATWGPLVGWLCQAV